MAKSGAVSGVVKLRERQDEMENKIHAVNSKVEDLGDKVVSVDSKIDQILSSLQAPGVIRTTKDVGNIDIPQPGTATMGMDDDGDSVIIRPGPETDLDNPYVKSKNEYEAFMNEPVTVILMKSNRPEDLGIVTVGVNGRDETFHADKEKTVPRKFVEGLARAKPVHYENHEYTETDGSRAVRWPGSRNLRYNFQVIHDPNPRGWDWLKSVMAQP